MAWAPGAWPEGFGPSIRTGKHLGGGGTPQGQGRHEMRPVDVADCPGWPVLPGSVAWMVARVRGQARCSVHTWGTHKDLTPIPVSDPHLQHPDLCPSMAPSLTDLNEGRTHSPNWPGSRAPAQGPE